MKLHSFLSFCREEFFILLATIRNSDISRKGVKQNAKSEHFSTEAGVRR